MVKIRLASLDDAENLCQIYDYYVRCTAISFEDVTPSAAEFARRMEEVMQRYPYFVAEEEGRVQGYAYAHPFVGRAAYDWCAETTIYLACDARHKGIGAKLYAALEEALLFMGIITMYACVGTTSNPDEYLNNNSADFHKHIGFRQVGEFKHCGRKFGQWYDMVWLEKQLSAPQENQPPVVKYEYR